VIYATQVFIRNVMEKISSIKSLKTIGFVKDVKFYETQNNQNKDV